MMHPTDRVTFALDCGAEVTVRVIVDPANCRRRDGACMTAEEIAGLVWLALQDEPTPAPTGEGPRER